MTNYTSTKEAKYSSCDSLFIGFDHAKEKDITCLTIARYATIPMGSASIDVIRTVYDDEAKELYEIVTSFSTTKRV